MWSTPVIGHIILTCGAMSLLRNHENVAMTIFALMVVVDKPYHNRKEKLNDCVKTPNCDIHSSSPPILCVGMGA
jgi:hypothetical protein